MKNSKDRRNINYSEKINRKIDSLLNQVGNMKWVEARRFKWDKHYIIETLIFVILTLVILVLFFILINPIINKIFQINILKLIVNYIKNFTNKLYLFSFTSFVVIVLIIIRYMKRKINKLENMCNIAYKTIKMIKSMVLYIFYFILNIFVIGVIEYYKNIEIEESKLHWITIIIYIIPLIYISFFMLNRKINHKINIFDNEGKLFLIPIKNYTLYLIFSILLNSIIIYISNSKNNSVLIFIVLLILNIIVAILLSRSFNFKEIYSKDKIFKGNLINTYTSDYVDILNSAIIFPRIKARNIENIENIISNSRIYYVDLSEIKGELYRIKTPYYVFENNEFKKKGFYLALPIDKKFNNKYLRINFTVKRGKKEYLEYILDIKIKYKYGDCIIENNSVSLVSIKHTIIKRNKYKYKLNINKDIILSIPTAILYTNYDSISELQLKIKNLNNNCIDKKDNKGCKYSEELENIKSEIKYIFKNVNNLEKEKFENKKELLIKKFKSLKINGEELKADKYYELSNILKDMHNIIYKYNNKLKVSTNGIIINKEEIIDQRCTLLINQKFGTGKTLAVINAMYELKKETARISFYEEPKDIDKVYKIFSNVKKIYTKNNLFRKIGYFFKIISKIINSPIIILYIFSIFAAIIISSISMLEKLGIKEPFKKENSIYLIFCFIITIGFGSIYFIPEIIKIVHRSSNNYIDFYLELTANLLVSGNIVLMIEDIDRMRSDDMFDVVSLISNYNFHLEELSSNICNIILSVDEKIFKTKLDSIYIESKDYKNNSNQVKEVSTFIEKTIYRTININNNIIMEYTRALVLFLEKYNKITGNSRIVSFDDNLTSLREVRKQYREQIK